MTQSQVKRPRLAAGFLLVLLVALLGLALLGAVRQDDFAQASYDSLHSWSGVNWPATDNSPVVIVYLDIPSYTERNLDPAQPWPRELHAQLLRRLKTAGAKTVVFDIVFSAAGPDATADRALADAIRDHGNVILAAEYNDKSSAVADNEHPWVKLGSVGAVYEPFGRAAAGIGLASLGIDDDRAVRRFVAGFAAIEQPALAWAAASALHLPVTQPAGAMGEANQTWIRYYGPPLTLPHVSYSQALATNGVPDDFFQGKIVFVGARTLVGSLNDRQDEFRSPFHSWKNKELFLPGVEVHATQLLNLLRHDNLTLLSRGGEILIVLLIALIFGGGLAWLRPLPATVASLAGAGLVFGLARVGFAQGVWFPWLVVVGAQIPAALGGAVLFHSLEWYHARKRFEAAKRIADAKIREQAALIDKAHDAILVQSLDGKILYANPSAEKLFGWKPATFNLQPATSDAASDLAPTSTWGVECSTLNVSELFAADSAAAETARAAALQHGEWNGELKLQTRSGSLVIVASRWTLIRDEAGRPRELLLINSDITEQKNLEQQFLRTQRMNTIGTLAGGMAHDLNNALAPILMGTQLLRRKATDDESRQLLGMMETSTHRGADMVRQVLLFARGRGGDFEQLKLDGLVRELEKMVRETFPKNISVEAFLPGDLWPVRGNPTQLHQVLLNLCVNARDAMPDGGKLSLVADNVELSAEELKEFQNGEPSTFNLQRPTSNAASSVAPDSALGVEGSMLNVSSRRFVSLLVSDTGTGMPPEVRAKIFEPFFSTKGEGRGTGIGLATVLRIVNSHGGFLRVESEPGQGTSFEVFLPRAVEIPATAAAATAEKLPRGHGELILLADDEQAIRELVASELTSFGYHVLAAANGAEAVTLFREHAGEVRLFITDQTMPVMDGFHAIAELRRLQPGLPVILTSGEVLADQLERIVPVGKPFALEELLVAIERSLKPA